MSKGSRDRSSAVARSGAPIWCKVCGKMRGGKCKCKSAGLLVAEALMEAIGYARDGEGRWYYPGDEEILQWRIDNSNVVTTVTETEETDQ